MVRRFGRAVAATACSLGLLYMSVVLWLAWSNPPFDLSGMEGELKPGRSATRRVCAVAHHPQRSHISRRCSCGGHVASLSARSPRASG
jgi:hypothetical protein